MSGLLLIGQGPFPGHVVGLVSRSEVSWATSCHVGHVFPVTCTGVILVLGTMLYSRSCGLVQIHGWHAKSLSRSRHPVKDSGQDLRFGALVHSRSEVPGQDFRSRLPVKGPWSIPGQRSPVKSRSTDSGQSTCTHSCHLSRTPYRQPYRPMHYTNVMKRHFCLCYLYS